MPHSVLSKRGLIRLSGEDTVSFLQGLVSNDVTRLQEGGAIYAAMLTPQGKFLHDFFVYKWDGRIYLDTDKERLPDLVKRLLLYKLRAKVDIEHVTHMGIAALWGDISLKPEKDLLAIRDPRHGALGWRVVGDVDILAAWCKAQGTEASYEEMRLALGIPDGAQDMIIEKSLLLEFGFESLHGVDFNKGCYVGQEVTARSKFRGQVRKFIYQVTAEHSLPVPGTTVYQGESEIGQIRSSAGKMGLALLQTEAVSNRELPIHAADTVLTVTLPSWTILK